ncbi:RNA methyltransferase [Mechercharimyces sp. CAU 1602]|uniref:TrmH family RNA methyltransferase n=1 Tax=Mechercharimyces sp. CAU 1602 TaxID=2973933 RepID=UPI002163FCD4|nr:RNA methyltransferase [Mechercharimyces sp. CAU 1602]MCS1351555.1 RNA methyltransferase [Mechercharimyces sp. CAU 1602]
MRIQAIGSTHNDKFKRWSKLKTSKGRKKYRALLIEGEHLLQEAMQAGWQVNAVIIDDENEKAWQQVEVYFNQEDDQLVYALESGLFHQLMETYSPQGIAAEVSFPAEIESIDDDKGVGPLLLLDEIQDPGNMGTLLRTAEAAGVAEVWIGEGTVDLYNSKVVRAAMGSLFRLRTRHVDLYEGISDLQQRGILVVGTALEGAIDCYSASYPDRVAFLFGNEGSGVDPSLQTLCDLKVKIPMQAPVESLNVSVSAAILLYDWVRRQQG